MHAFTRPSAQLRKKVRAATLRSLHHTSLYRRLVLNAKDRGARTAATGDSLHTRLRENPREGSTLLKFIYGQLYNGKLAKIYGHAPTDACPLCHLPDSCTHIAGECRFHKNLTISRHNAACQLVHAAIRNAAKGGGALYGADDLRLVMADAGTRTQTPLGTLTSLAFTSQDDPHTQEEQHPQTTDWLEPLPPEADTRHKRHTDVSQDPRYNQVSTHTDTECTSAPTRIPAWILPLETQDALFAAGHGTAPDLIYARGVPDTPEPDPTTFDRKNCNLIVNEVFFCRDFGCHERRQEKTAKYIPLINALKEVWGKVEFVAIPIGHAGTTLAETQRHLAQAMAATRPEIERNRASRQVRDPDSDSAARTHDSSLFKALLLALTKLAQSRLLGIIHHRQSLVHAQVGEVRRNRATSAATPAPGPPPQAGTTPTHTMHHTRIPESTAIT
jgi:hypothetical protein